MLGMGMDMDMLREITGMTTVSHTAASASHAMNLEWGALRKIAMRHSPASPRQRQRGR
ncbi:MAG: hypothetical protein ACYCZD_01040 [Rhodanobacter sp.]